MPPGLLFACKASEHDANHGDMHHGLTAAWCPLIIFGQATVAIKPAKGAFNDPAAWQDFEAFDVVVAFDDFKHPTTDGFDPLNQWTAICPICPNECEARKLSFCSL